MKFQTYILIGDDEELDVEVEYNATHRPAKLHGAWEDSHPEESEMEITSVAPLDIWPEGLSTDQFSMAVHQAHDRLEMEAWEDFAAQQEDRE